MIKLTSYRFLIRFNTIKHFSYMLKRKLCLVGFHKLKHVFPALLGSSFIIAKIYLIFGSLFVSMRVSEAMLSIIIDINRVINVGSIQFRFRPSTASIDTIESSRP